MIEIHREFGFQNRNSKKKKDIFIAMDCNTCHRICCSAVVGFPTGLLLKRFKKKMQTLIVLLSGITLTMLSGWLINTFLLSGITLNYMLMGVSFAAVFSNMVTQERLNEISDCFSPILAISLLAAIVDLGAPLNYHLILGAGAYTFVYILARAFGKYFGAMFGAKILSTLKLTYDEAVRDGILIFVCIIITDLYNALFLSQGVVEDIYNDLQNNFNRYKK